MNALVVYESMFGGTQAIAEAIAAGLSSGMRVTLVEVGAAPTTIDESVTLLVVGGPTHAFGLSRPRTREDARESAGSVVSESIGVREWLATVTAPSGLPAAAFGTKIGKPRVPGSSASAAAKRIRRRGLELVADPADFFVLGRTGPLADGELSRARRWGRTLAETFGNITAA